MARGLAAACGEAAAARLERAATIGRPLGPPARIAMLEARLGRSLAPRKPGPKRQRRQYIAPATSLPGIMKTVTVNSADHVLQRQDRIPARAPGGSAATGGAPLLRRLELSGAELEEAPTSGGDSRAARGPAWFAGRLQPDDLATNRGRLRSELVADRAAHTLLDEGEPP